jgi:hypothetical protein
MPGSKERGRTIPSQAKSEINKSDLGVCNDKVLPPKGKVLSELHRNVERLAEMTSPN